MVPLDLAVSGSPPGFWLFSGSPAISVECLVSALLTPSCFPDWMVMEPGALDAEGWRNGVELANLSATCSFEDHHAPCLLHFQALVL